VIALVASPGDLHARHIGRQLERMGQRACFINTREFGQGALIDYPIEGAARITAIDGGVAELDEVHTVWHRRPNYGHIGEGIRDPDIRHFCREEWASSFDGLLLNSDAYFVNPLPAEFAAVKPRQLHVAAAAGLRIPDTLITNDPERAEAFVERHRGRVIHKALTVPKNRLLDTRQWTEDARPALAELPLAPTMFQERILGPADVRATVIGEEILAARIATAQGRNDVDSRFDLDVPYAAHPLPGPVTRSLLELMRVLGLVFGTIDMKITDDGDYVFLEVNPQGQFLYVELLTDQPIAQTLARFLAQRVRPPRAGATQAAPGPAATAATRA
jgi:glutathione synthase/RimK-type ligase-like ATP-grasp enzyme